MMVRRSAGVMRDQFPISASVRKQPVQIFASGWMAHSFLQGLSISARFQMSSVTLGSQMAQTVQRPLQNIACCDVVDDLVATFSGCIRL